MLRDQYWPGNVRQLRNAVTHAVINAKGYRIGPEDLPELAAPPDGPAPAGGALNLDQVERAAIRRVLERTGGHHENAAGLLGISRRTLSRKLKIYRVESSEEAGRLC